MAWQIVGNPTEPREELRTRPIGAGFFLLGHIEGLRTSLQHENAVIPLPRKAFRHGKTVVFLVVYNSFLRFSLFTLPVAKNYLSSVKR